jgi:predicted nucleotidyltransferase component of viral defense system
VFRYRYETAFPGREIEGCRVASLEDVGAMKLAAICQRSVKRDYVDLHAILTAGGVTVRDLVNAWNRKYPGKDVAFALRALVYFQDVDKARMPDMFAETTWETIKVDLEDLVAGYP